MFPAEKIMQINLRIIDPTLVIQKVKTLQQRDHISRSILLYILYPERQFCVIHMPIGKLLSYCQDTRNV